MPSLSVLFGQQNFSYFSSLSLCSSSSSSSSSSLSSCSYSSSSSSSCPHSAFCLANKTSHWNGASSRSAKARVEREIKPLELYSNTWWEGKHSTWLQFYIFHQKQVALQYFSYWGKLNPSLNNSPCTISRFPFFRLVSLDLSSSWVRSPDMNPNKSEFKFAQKINLLLTRIAFAVGSVAQVSKPSFLRLNFKFKIKWNGINCSWRDRSSVKAILWRKLLYRRPQNRPTAINTIYTLSLGGNKLCFLFDFTTFKTSKGSPFVKSRFYPSDELWP